MADEQLRGAADYESLVQQVADVSAVFVQRVVGLPADAWSAPGLGEWTVRELIGHTMRAFATVDNFLDHLLEQNDAAAPPHVLAADSAAEYYRLALSMAPDIHQQVAERGRVAGSELGDDPTSAVVDRIGGTLGRLSATDGTEVGSTVIGHMRLVDYLPTRLVELVVHLTDLCVAVDQPIPELGPATLTVLGAVAASAGSHDRVLVLRSMVGREPLPPGFTVWP